MNMKNRIGFLAVIIVAVTMIGCATKSKIDWDARIGKVTYDDVVREMGPPDKETSLSDGSRVGDWFLRRGPVSTTFQTFPSGWTTQGITHQFPDRLIRLSFGRDGRLTEWKRVYR